MRDWNVVVTIHQGHFKQAIDILQDYARTDKTDYFNVLVMQLDDTARFPDLFDHVDDRAADAGIFSRIMPAQITFNFQSASEFEARLKQTVEPWLELIAAGSFHVRMHRRGFKGRLSSQDEERFVDRYLLHRLEQQGSYGSIDFDDPDYVLDIETVGQRAGVSLWSRQQRMRYALLKLD